MIAQHIIVKHLMRESSDWRFCSLLNPSSLADRVFNIANKEWNLESEFLPSCNWAQVMGTTRTSRKVRKQSVRRFARPTDELMGLAGLPLVRWILFILSLFGEQCTFFHDFPFVSRIAKECAFFRYSRNKWSWLLWWRGPARGSCGVGDLFPRYDNGAYHVLR